MMMMNVYFIRYILYRVLIMMQWIVLIVVIRITIEVDIRLLS